MPTMVHGDFKPGEICRANGAYECRTCRSVGRASRITMERGGTFPECPSCKERGALEVDTIWKITAAA